MNEFIDYNSSWIYHTAEFIAAITGVILFRYYKNSSISIFILYLVYVFFLDSIGGYPKYFRKYEFLSAFNTAIEGTRIAGSKWWYTIFWEIGSPVFLAFFYYKTINNYIFRRIIKWSAIVFFIASIITVLSNFETFFHDSLKIPEYGGLILIISCISMYFIDLLKSDKLFEFYRLPTFYISCILLFWYIIMNSLTFYEPFYHRGDMAYVYLRKNIYAFAIVSVYLSYALLLIILKTKRIDYASKNK